MSRFFTVHCLHTCSQQYINSEVLSVAHVVIHDDNEIGNRMATDQSAIRTNFHA